MAHHTIVRRVLLNDKEKFLILTADFTLASPIKYSSLHDTELETRQQLISGGLSRTDADTLLSDAHNQRPIA